MRTIPTDELLAWKRVSYRDGRTAHKILRICSHQETRRIEEFAGSQMWSDLKFLVVCRPGGSPCVQLRARVGPVVVLVSRGGDDRVTYARESVLRIWGCPGPGHPEIKRRDLRIGRASVVTLVHRTACELDLARTRATRAAAAGGVPSVGRALPTAAKARSWAELSSRESCEIQRRC